MTQDCGALQDRMPLVAADREAWTAAEADHVATCPDCAAEWRVVAAARRLGDRAAARVQPADLSRAVLTGLAGRRRSARWTRFGWITGLAAAAAIVLLVGRERPPDAMVATGSGVKTLHLPLAELEAVDVEVLEAVLDQLDAPVGEGTSVDAPALGDLDDTQLERVLRSLEG